MAKYRRVRFLKYFNRPRVFVSIEIDTVLMFAGISLGVFVAFSLTSIMSPYASLMFGLLMGGIGAIYYSKYKEESSKGFLKHFLYVYHIYKVNPNKYKEEVQRMDIDVEKYYPNPNEKLFIE